VVLSDETRLAIAVLLSLKGPLTAKQIAYELGLSPTTVLDHFRELHDALVVRGVEVAEKRHKRAKML